METNVLNEKEPVLKRIALFLWRNALLLIVSAVIVAAIVAVVFKPPVHYDLSPHDEPRYGEEGSDTSLLVIQDKNGKYGYGDARGNVVIPCRYDAASPFFEGLAAVKRGWKWGYIDDKGKTVIPFRYWDASDFHNGKAFVGTGLIKPVASIPAFVKSRLIDKAGKTVRDTPYIDVLFNEGQYLAQRGSVGPVDYLDEEYNVISTTGSWSQYKVFHEGIAKFYYTDNDNQRWFFEDRDGREIARGFSKAQDFSGGLAAVKIGEDSLWRYIDATGQTAIAPAFSEAFPFGDGLAAVKMPDGAGAVIDTSGRVVAKVSCAFDTAKAFHEGMCAVGVESSEKKLQAMQQITGLSFHPDDRYLWGFIDASGRIAVECRYDRVSAFVNGIAEVVLNGKIGYIDKSGNYIWEPK